MTALAIPSFVTFVDSWTHKGSHSRVPFRNAGTEAPPEWITASSPETPENLIRDRPRQRPQPGCGERAAEWREEGALHRRLDTWALFLPPALTHLLTLGGGEVVAWYFWLSPIKGETFPSFQVFLTSVSNVSMLCSRLTSFLLVKCRYDFYNILK